MFGSALLGGILLAVSRLPPMTAPVSRPPVEGETSQTEAQHLKMRQDQPRQHPSEEEGEHLDVWPNLFGPRHDSTAPPGGDRIPPWDDEGPPIVWRTPCGSGYSSPIVWRNRLILLDRLGNEERIACLRTSDGGLVWEHRYPTSFVCGSHYSSGPYSTPATDGEYVYALGAEGKLTCLTLAGGQVVWSCDLTAVFQVPPGVFGAGHSPLLWEERLILNVGGTAPESGIIAFDKRTGQVVWRATHHGAAFATPRLARIHDRSWLFVFTADGLSLLDPHSGQEQWCLEFASRVTDMYNAVTPLVHEDLVMISAWGVGSKVVRIHPDGSWTEVWDSNRLLTSQYTPLLAHQGCVMGVHALDNSLRCLELATGRLRWRWKSELGNAIPLAIGRQVILLGEYGHLGLIDWDTEQVVTQALTTKSLLGAGQRCFSAPAYAFGRLYLRNESEVLCLNLTGPAKSE